MTTTSLTVERIVDKLAELSEQGTKAVCLTCEEGKDSKLKNFAHDHSNKIGKVARVKFPFFVKQDGAFTLGTRGYFWSPRSVIGGNGNLWPRYEDCINFPLSEV